MLRRVFVGWLSLILIVLCTPSVARALEFRVCVKPPDVPPRVNQWIYELGSATVVTTRNRVQFAQRAQGHATYIYDPYAPPSSVSVLPIPYNKLKCPPPPPRPKPTPAKEEKKPPPEETKPAAPAQASEEAKPKPKPPPVQRDEQGNVIPPGAKKMPERPPTRPKPSPPPPEGILSNEPLLPSTSTLPKRDEVHPPKCVDEQCTMVDRGGALPELQHGQGRSLVSAVPCAQTKEGCKGNGKGTGDGTGEGPEKTSAEKLIEELAYLAAIADGSMNEDTKRADGKRFGIIGGQNPDGFDNPVAQAVAVAITLTAAGKAEAKAFFKKLHQAAKNKTRLILTQADLSEETAKLLSESKLGPVIADALHGVGAIGPYKIMGKFTKGKGGQWEAHHIFETAKMRDFGFDPKDGPSVLLTREAHIKIGKDLREATKRLPEDWKKPDLWKMYQKVYKGSPHWLKAIESYFVN